MNEKLAKRLRRAAAESCAVGEIPAKTAYTESSDLAWGPLPRNKESGKVDKKALRKLINKSSNPKFKNFPAKNKFGTIIDQIKFRYIIGIPAKLENCYRKEYQTMKKNYVEVAQGAN